MAVLYALLGNNPAVRTRKYDELTGRYDSELAGKKILRLTTTCSAPPHSNRPYCAATSSR